MTSTFDLNTPLFHFPNDPATAFTIKQSLESVFVVGASGAGKTSGSGRFLALQYLSHGYGGLVLTAKISEADQWREYCERTGRLDDLIVVEPGAGYSFNFIEYESKQIHSGKSFTQTLVEVLETVIAAGEEKSSGRNDDIFWQESLHLLIKNVCGLCMMAYDTVTVQDMYEIVTSIPKQGDKGFSKEDEETNAFKAAYSAAASKLNDRIDQWKASWTAEQRLRREKPDVFERDLLHEVPEARTFRFLDRFFLDTFHDLSSKTRSVIDFSFIGFLDRLLDEPVYSLFCKNPSNYTPDDCWLKGKIIVLNLPTELYHKAGRDIQCLVKELFERSVRKRDVRTNPRCVFLWADEMQNFITPHDADFGATARSAKVACVYLTQNLSNLYANMGGNKSRDKVESLLSTMNTKIFHANSSVESNKWASELFGQAYYEDFGRNVTVSNDVSIGKSTNYKLEYIVRPEKFQLLLNGGEENRFIVEAYIHLQGKTFSNRLNHCKISFKQI